MQGQEIIEMLYHAIEMEMLTNIGKRIGNGDMVDTGKEISWQIDKLSQLGQLRTEQLKVLAKYAGMTILELKKFIRETGIAELNEFDRINKPLIDAMNGYIEPSGNLYDRLLAFEKQASSSFNFVNTNLVNSSEQVYVDIVTKSATRSMTGNITMQQAVAEIAKEWGQIGIPALIDKAGKRWSVEAYVRMVTLNTSKNVAVQMQNDRLDDYGLDLVEISSHVGSRPSHIDYQGKIFSRSGKSKKYPSLLKTSYGDIDGIVTGTNCQHKMYGYMDGVSIQRNFPYDKEESIEKYEQSQKQRRYEREIRKAKKEQQLIKAMELDKKEIDRIEALIKKREDRMKQFIKETGRKRRYDREKIVS